MPGASAAFLSKRASFLRCPTPRKVGPGRSYLHGSLRVCAGLHSQWRKREPAGGCLILTTVSFTIYVNNTAVLGHPSPYTTAADLFRRNAPYVHCNQTPPHRLFAVGRGGVRGDAGFQLPDPLHCRRFHLCLCLRHRTAAAQPAPAASKSGISLYGVDRTGGGQVFCAGFYHAAQDRVQPVQCRGLPGAGAGNLPASQGPAQRPL